MAVDILSIPAMAAEIERVFSEAKTTINEGRWSLELDTIEALQCLKPWFRAEYYTKEDFMKWSEYKGNGTATERGGARILNVLRGHRNTKMCCRTDISSGVVRVKSYTD